MHSGFLAASDYSSGPCVHSYCKHSLSIAVVVRNLIWMTFKWISGQDGVSMSLLPCDWVRRGFCSVGQMIGQTSVTVLMPSLICREYFLICGEGNTGLALSLFLSLRLF